MVETLKIEAMCILAAIIYGIAHDMVTAHLCIEYFTVGHYDVYRGVPTPAWRYALYWGVAATWWVGAGLGILVILFARVSSRWPRFTARRVARPLVSLLGLQWAAAMGVLAVAYLVLGEDFYVTGGWASEVPVAHHRAFVAAWITHMFSYAAGGFSALALCAIILHGRWRAAKAERTRAAAAVLASRVEGR